MTHAADRPLLDARSLAALGLEWAIIAGAGALAITSASPWVALGAFVVIATRQHGLLMLYHDAVHGSLAADRRLNDALINALVGVPALLPVEVYRRLHLAHHRCLGTDEDPERRLLYARQLWRYQPLPTWRLARQLLGDLFLVNAWRTIAAWRPAGGALTPSPVFVVLAAVWLGGLVTAVLVAPATTLLGLVFWFAPLMTLTNLLQKLRSFAEHSGGPGATPGWGDWTYSWRPGWLGRLTLWPYNINLHREHHDHPDVPWHQLPRSVDARAPILDGAQLRRIVHA